MMKAKDFLNYKKPHFWTALVIILVLIFAAAVGLYQKNKEVSAPVEEEVPEEIQVEIEEPEEEPKKDDGQIILERFMQMDWEEVKAQAKAFGEEGWEKGIVVLAELPEAGITLYGYNDADYQYRGAAVDHNGNVNYFDWVYTSSQHIQPEMYWKAEEGQLQITLNLYDGTGVNAEELHVLVEHDTKTMEDFVFRSSDYLATIEERINGTGTTVGSYVDIKLGDTIMLQFEPVKTADGVETVLKLHQAVIYLNPSKDGYVFELGDIGVEPEKRTAKITVEGMEEEYTEVQYLSDNGYSIWYPENLLLSTINGHEGFLYKEDSDTEISIVPEGDMKLTDSYLKEAAGNFKSSGQYKKVTVSKIEKLKADSEDVTIKKIQVVHDDTADCFYIVRGKDNALLVTFFMKAEALEGMSARVDKMLQTITFSEADSEADAKAAE